MRVTSLTTLSCNSHLLSERETFQIMASLPKDPPEDPKKLSFWMVRSAFMFIPALVCLWTYSSGCCSHHLSTSQPGNYVRTVHRTEKSFQACNDIVACFAERAKVEKQYAQQLSQWSSKWKSIVDSSMYGRLCDLEPLWFLKRTCISVHCPFDPVSSYLMSSSAPVWNFPADK